MIRLWILAPLITLYSDSTPDSSVMESGVLSKRVFSFPGVKGGSAASVSDGRCLLSKSEDPIGILAE